MTKSSEFVTRLRRLFLRLCICACLLSGGAYTANAWMHRIVRRVPTKSPTEARLLASAKAQIGTRYDSSYQIIAYPGGDMPARTGACTDIVIRAARSTGWDLQQLVHEDILVNRAAYPALKGNKPLDVSIDHRRVPNLSRFLSRHAINLTCKVSSDLPNEWRPGDIVCWKTLFGRDHIGIVSDGVDASGLPCIIHNEYGCVEESCLTRWRIVGHFRIPDDEPPPSFLRY